MLVSSAFALFALASVAFADPEPLTPVVTNEGSTCTISWTPDTTGKWKETNIQLMTGDNFAMKHITTIAKVDTTTGAPTTFTYPCPLVTPNAVIYFYQFSTPTAPTQLVWTTRFGIADSTGKLEEPEFATQPDGKAIPWGIGNLEDPSKATPPPTYITGQGLAGSGTPSGVLVSSSAPLTSSTRGTTVAAATLTTPVVATAATSPAKVQITTTHTAGTTTATVQASRESSSAMTQGKGSIAAVAIVAVFAGIFGMA